MYCCCWSSPAQSRWTQDHILSSQFLRLPQPGGPGPHIYIPQEQDGPDIPSGTGFLSRNNFKDVYFNTPLPLYVSALIGHPQVD
jgi:hypothetical protein